MRGCCPWSSVVSDEGHPGVAVFEVYVWCSLSAGLLGDPQPWQTADGGFPFSLVFC